MALIIIYVRANLGGNEQLLLDSLMHKDTYETDKYEPFEFFFDVEHWIRYDTDTTKRTPSAQTYLFQALRTLNCSISEPVTAIGVSCVHHDPDLHDQWNPN